MKILCFGDSNTYGYDPCGFFGGRYPAQHRWVDLLGEKLGCDTINAGENGREIPRLNGQLQGFHRLLAVQGPVDLLVIMLGTNDLLQGNPPQVVARRMDQFLRQICPVERKVLLLGLPPMEPGAWVPDIRLVEAAREVNRQYQSLAEGLGLGFGDPLDWGIRLAFDGVHLAPEGHRALAEGLAAYLNKGV